MQTVLLVDQGVALAQRGVQTVLPPIEDCQAIIMIADTACSCQSLHKQFESILPPQHGEVDTLLHLAEEVFQGRWYIGGVADSLRQVDVCPNVLDVLWVDVSKDRVANVINNRPEVPACGGTPGLSAQHN